MSGQNVPTDSSYIIDGNEVYAFQVTINTEHEISADIEVHLNHFRTIGKKFNKVWVIPGRFFQYFSYQWDNLPTKPRIGGRIRQSSKDLFSTNSSKR